MFDVIITWLKINNKAVGLYDSTPESLCFWPITTDDFDIKSRTKFSLAYLEYAHLIEHQFEVGDTASLLLTHNDSYMVECKCCTIHPLSFEILSVVPVIEYADDKTSV